ncbi:metal tolerance 3 [Fusarium beomiforme]|uniref:Metal tolerance 3 n=1 Tax=Fusarium beomiforme TaxID=44412 RepID=A0A9P5A9E6_9HYPO|nr:metal tolerance 3 [Fusarium beomiforme]
MGNQTKIAMSLVHSRAQVQGKDVKVQNDIDDPLGLSAHIKLESDMPRANTSRKRHLGLKKNHPLQEIYKTQNQSIRAMLKSVEEHEQEVTDAHGANTVMYSICVKGSLGANIILSGLQLYGAISSSSLSLFTTMADSIFDPMSGIMLYMAHRAVNKVDPNKYPSGRARISTAGNIVFSFIMFSVSLILIVIGGLTRWAIILSVLIAGLWLHTAYDEFQLMIGVTADRDILQLITYISRTHSPVIQQVDTVRAYYSGPRLLAEVDIVIDRNERVEVAHDVAEGLQIKLEKLPVIERAFVHIDYETSHKPVGSSPQAYPNPILLTNALRNII